MTRQVPLHIFTPEQLHEHDMALATDVSHFVTKHVLDQIRGLSLLRL